MSNSRNKLDSFLDSVKKFKLREKFEVDLATGSELNDASQETPTEESVIALPKTKDQVVALIKLAAENNLPVVTRGSRTGLSGGSVPLEPSLVLDLSQMNAVREFDPEARRLVVEAGTTLGQIEDLLDPLGFFYPPDPASYRAASIGGTVATNAGGLRCVKYGVTSEWVQTLEVVLATGELINLGHPVVKDSTGLNLKPLFIGSEGALGVITAVGITFLPKPEKRHMTLAAFASLKAATDSVTRVMARLTPSTCELIDAGALYTRDTSPVEKILGSLESWGDDPPLLMIEVDGAHADAELQILLEALPEKSHTVQAEELEEILAVRRGANPRRSAFRAGEAGDSDTATGTDTVEALVTGTRGIEMLAQDLSVPVSKLSKTTEIIRKHARDFKLDSRILAHAGDGNLHILLSLPAGTPGANETLEKAMAKILRETFRFGAAVSGEHGIGSLKIAWAREDLGEETVRAMQLIKSALDPHGLLNPGKAF